MAELERLSVRRDPIVAQLLSAGMAALRSGQKERAYRLLHQAASLDPYDESIWWGLLEVVRTDDDRTACLENILAINPANLEARRLLKLSQMEVSLTDLTPAIPAQPFSTVPSLSTVWPLPSRRKRSELRRRIVRMLILIVVFTILAAALGVVLSILIYGF